MPRPAALVVKNGSKMRSITSGAMPSPVSFTSITTYSPGATSASRVRTGAASVRAAREISSTPPPGIACTAFEARFMTSWCRRVGSPITIASSSGSFRRRSSSGDEEPRSRSKTSAATDPSATGAFRPLSARL